MNRKLEILLLSSGAATLFAATFIGAIASSDRDMSEVPVVGSLFGAPEPIPIEAPLADESDEPPAPSPPGPTPAESRAELIESQVGLLAAHAESVEPGEAALRELADMFKARARVLDAREAELVDRERLADVRQGTLDEQVASIEQMRRDIEQRWEELRAFERQLALREEALQAGETARDAREKAALRETGKLFEEGDVEELAARLLLFEPEEAAIMLRALRRERAGELLAALPTDRWRTYQEAYAKAGLTGE